MNKREDGALYESKAIEYLTGNGFELIEHNYRYHKSGEIDIVGKDVSLVGSLKINYLVFVEVKHRSNNQKGEAAYAVDIKKQRQICKLSRYYLVSNKYSENTPVRYDVVAIDGEDINWIKNAFEYIN